MNGRIKDIAKEAQQYAEWTTPQGLEWFKPFQEKFAELIVQECIDVALAQKKWVEDQVVFDSRDVTWNKARTQQSQHIVNKIKEHFEVDNL